MAMVAEMYVPKDTAGLAHSCFVSGNRRPPVPATLPQHAFRASSCPQRYPQTTAACHRQQTAPLRHAAPDGGG
jgi:hypothetical protein